MNDRVRFPFRHSGTIFSDIFRYIGPGLLVTVGFIDPGNWAANVAAGSGYGYRLLWMVTLSTLMLILLQHNAAHLGIVTGLCMAEAANRHLSPLLSRPLLAAGWLASVATVLAEILGAAVALRMLTGLPERVGAAAVFLLSLRLLLSRSYTRIERLIIGFVSIIGICFVFELLLVDVSWKEAAVGWVKPAFPHGSLTVIMSVLGAVVMPHNLFLHSEIIQSRRWNEAGEEVMVSRLKYEFLDTLFSMLVGWAINSAMILVAAATFFRYGMDVTDLTQAERMLRPLLGPAAGTVFAVALLLAGISSSITAGMAGGSIVAGMYGEAYNSTDPHTRRGVGVTLAAGALLIFFVADPFKGLVWSQVFLSMLLPWTMFLLIYLTSSRKIMGKFANRLHEKVLLVLSAVVVTVLNVMLLIELFR